MSGAGKTLAVSVFFLFSLLNNAFAQRINVSFSSLTGTQSPLWVAKEAGFFKQHGLDARLVYIPGGSVVVQAMHSGELQFGVSGPPRRSSGAIWEARISRLWRLAATRSISY